MEKQVFNPEQFEKTVVLLKQYGVAQREKDHRAVQRHNKAYFDYGDTIASFVPDAAPIQNSFDIGKTVVNLLSTIPGVDTKGILEQASKETSIAISHKALSIDLRKQDGGVVEMYLTFPDAIPIPDDEYFTFELRRSDGGKEISLGITMDSGCFPRRGEIKVSDVDGNGRIPRHTVKFGQDSVITEGSKYMGVEKGEELKIVKLISEITSPEKLESPINPGLIVQKARTPQLP